MSNVIDLAARRATRKPKQVRCLTILLADPEPPVDLAQQGYRFHTVELRQMQGVRFYAVYGWHERPDQKALQRQDLTRHAVATFQTLQAAQAAYPQANHIGARSQKLVLRSYWPDELKEMSKHRTVTFLHRPVHATADNGGEPSR